MSTENWSNNQEPQYVGRSYNGNYRPGPRREGGNGGAGNGYQGNRPYSGGYGQRSYGQNGGNGAGRQYYGQQDRQPRQNYNGQPRNPGFNNFQQGSASSIIEIDTNKVGMVIGRGGGKIREIQQNFNVHVKIDRDPGVNGFTGVTIRGEEASIAQAKNFIQDLVAVK